MINFDKMLKLRSIFNEILLIAEDTDFKNDTQLSEKICQLLDTLVHMQSLNVSIRSELIEKMFSIRPDLPHEIINQIKKGTDNVVLFDRRKVSAERRKLQTFLANDRRTGIVNRRKSAKNDRAEIRSHWEQSQL